jgi:hypothetical protein
MNWSIQRYNLPWMLFPQKVDWFIFYQFADKTASVFLELGKMEI